LIAAAARKWLDDRAPSMGAALAYYTAFSLAPLLVIVIAVAGLAVGHEGAQTAIVAQMRDLLGDAGGDAIAGMLAQTSDLGHGVFALGVGIVALLLGATTAFAELEDDLDHIWHAEPQSANGLINMLRGRLLSFGMVLCVGFLLTVSLLVNAGISSLGQYMFGSTEAILQLLNLAASIAVTTILFAAIYKILPNVRIAWADVWVGALVTSVLFAVGRWLIGLYIGKSAVAATFGSAGPLWRSWCGSITPRRPSYLALNSPMSWHRRVIPWFPGWPNLALARCGCRSRPIPRRTLRSALHSR